MNFAQRILQWPGSHRLRNGARRRALALYDPWRQFWFTPADPTPLAVMRILFGGMLLYTQFVWGLNLEGFVGADGWQGSTLVRTLQSDQFAWSFWWWIPHGLHFTAHLLCLVILTLFMLGAYTPVTSVLAYLITISYSSRAPMANYGLDQINGLAALYLAIGPSGSRLSIDRWRLRYRAARKQFSLGREPVVMPVEPSARANLALRLVQVHLCVIYVFACLSKLQGESWWSGTAIWQAVSNLEYQSRDVTWLAWYPWLVNLLTHVTIAWEMTFWALVWRPMLRPFVLAVGTAIHLGIGAFMGMWTFGLAVIFAYVAFIPGRQISAILRRAAQLTVPLLRSLHAVPDSSASIRARAAWFALGLDTGDRERTDREPAEERSPSPMREPSLVPTPVVAEVVPSPIAEAPHTTVAPLNGKSRGRADLLPTRPSVLLIEGRLKRQAEVQEYFLKHGFRCSVASELHQARSMLAVIDFDVLVVTSSWFLEHELSEFHDALIGGGPALPASVLLVGSPQGRSDAQGFQESPRHRVLVGSLSLRELRLLVLEVLGLTEESLAPFVARPTRSKNGRHPAPSAPATVEASPSPQPATHDSPSVSDGNGSPS
ncbi:MAG TPA: hypothetical protein VFG04_10280 [Planctomycetaceae bacterium]|jgi:hypothetical protein|nr:hypothetical protein [Planctomycetaceae bacterium]